jgi:hypothetical protein
VPHNLHSWHNLVLIIAYIHLNEHSDVFRWPLKTDGQFFVSSMYHALLNSSIVSYNSHVWKIQIPLKFKVFIWLLYREEILTKDDLVKRNWYGDGMYCFCNNHEMIQHLLYNCTLAKFIWSNSTNIRVRTTKQHQTCFWSLGT